MIIGIPKIPEVIEGLSASDVVEVSKKCTLHVSKDVLKEALSHTDNDPDDKQLLRDEYHRVLDLLADRHL